MKNYVLRETTGYAYITRNGNLYQLSLGETFTEEELATLMCTVPVTYLCTEDNSITTVGPAPVVEPVKAAPAPAKAAPAKAA